MDGISGKDLYFICLHLFQYTSQILAFNILIFFKWNLIFSKMWLGQATDLHFYSPFGLV